MKNENYAWAVVARCQTLNSSNVKPKWGEWFIVGRYYFATSGVPVPEPNQGCHKALFRSRRLARQYAINAHSFFIQAHAVKVRVTVETI